MDQSARLLQPKESGLYYYEARYYDAEIGRFVSVDPWFGDITDPQSLNKYAYVRNNPIIAIDPTGEKTEIVVRFANQPTGFLDKANKTDFGHVLINLDNNYYGWNHTGSLMSNTGVMQKMTETEQMSSTVYQNTEFMFFELDITDEQERQLETALNVAHNAPEVVGNYNLTNQNCTTEAMKVLNNSLGTQQFSGSTSLTTPEDVANSLWEKSFVNGSIIKNVEGRYTNNSEITRVENLPEQHTKWGIFNFKNDINDVHGEILKFSQENDEEN